MKENGRGGIVNHFRRSTEKIKKEIYAIECLKKTKQIRQVNDDGMKYLCVGIDRVVYFENIGLIKINY